MSTSANYRKLMSREEIAAAKHLSEAWKNSEIPYRQWRAFEQERILASIGKAEQIPPFRAFIEATHYISGRELNETLDILDVGAGSGYYGELLRLYGPDWYYTACDFNSTFHDIAKKYLPKIRFDLADARDLPYANKTFDVSMVGLSESHPDDWKLMLAEAARVASKYVILNRVFLIEATTAYVKTAYDIPVVETWISPKELKTTCDESGLEILKEIVVNPEYPQITFVCSKK